LLVTKIGSFTTLSLNTNCGEYRVTARDAYGNTRSFGVSSLGVAVDAGAGELGDSCASTATGALAVTASADQKFFFVKGTRVGELRFHFSSPVSSTAVSVQVERLDYDFFSVGRNTRNFSNTNGADLARAVVPLGGDDFAVVGSG